MTQNETNEIAVGLSNAIAAQKQTKKEAIIGVIFVGIATVGGFLLGQRIGRKIVEMFNKYRNRIR